VRSVLRAGTATVPRLDRTERAAAYRDQIVELLHSVRVGRFKRIPTENARAFERPAG
jgi:hypothetical protein